MGRRSTRHVLIAVVATLVLAVPTTALATHLFTDVADSNVHATSIEWLANTGVTRGCNPPTNDQFCPRDEVTREQMATFMFRLSGNDELTEPSVNAAQLGGVDAASHVSGLEVVTEQFPVALNDGDSTGNSVQCPEGKYVTGGGVSILDNNGLIIRRTIPQTDLSGWTGGVEGIQNGASGIMSVYAICAATTPVTTD